MIAMLQSFEEEAEEADGSNNASSLDTDAADAVVAHVEGENEYFAKLLDYFKKNKQFMLEYLGSGVFGSYSIGLLWHNSLSSSSYSLTMHQSQHPNLSS